MTASACRDQLIREVAPTTAGQALVLSLAFTAEQHLKAQRIWNPLLKKLGPLLKDAEPPICADTPEGLIIQSRQGWSLALCCLETGNLPHFIAARASGGDDSNALRAYLHGDAYQLRTFGEISELISTVMRSALYRLGGKYLDESGTSRQVRSPSLTPAQT